MEPIDLIIKIEQHKVEGFGALDIEYVIWKQLRSDLEAILDVQPLNFEVL
jgi:hypothetical protein